MFPKTFKFGCASAAYQTEGAWNLAGRSPNVWDTMIHKNPELIAEGLNADVGPDSYHFYKEDVKALKSVGFQHYRFSVAWNRIIPNISLVVNQKGIDHYSALIDELIANEIEPIITMHHWDLPQYIQDLGGFANPLIIKFFEHYADVLFKNFGSRVKTWLTFNEPYNVCIDGYGVGSVPPLVKASGVGEYLCTYHLLQAHAAAYHLSKNKYENQNSQLGIALNTKHHFSEDPINGDYISNRAQEYKLGLFSNPIFSKDGGFPQIMIDEIGNSSVKEGHPWSRLPTMTDEVKKSIKGSADFFGFNYYTSKIVKPLKKTSEDIPGFANDVGLELLVDPTWKQAKSKWLFNVPQGLNEILIWIRNHYDNPPVFIFENGWSDEGELEDDGRIEFLKDHLVSLIKSMKEDNCNVIGYTVWSIIDSFEWYDGYTEKFGIFSVNMSSPTKERTPKKSAHFLKDVIRKRSIFFKLGSGKRNILKFSLEMWIVNALILFVSFITAKSENISFPETFIFGSASAAYQVEGAWNLDGKTPSIWDTMTHDHPELIAEGLNADVGPDSYHFYKEDVKALQSVGFQHYRFSVAWTRIIPNISLVVNQKGIDYYSSLIDELIANDIEPVITMYHWDLPQYIQDLGGFVNPLIIKYYEHYADVLFKNFGSRVKTWITFNQPYNFCIEGYGDGIFAPLVKAAGVGEYLCIHHVLQAHAAAYHLSKNKYREQNSQLGISLNTKQHYSADPKDVYEISDRAQEYSLGLFANPIFSKDGGYPQIMIDEIGNSSVKEGHPWSRLPPMTDEVKKSIQGSADFLGLNYYTSRIIKPKQKTLNDKVGFVNDVGIDLMIDPSWKMAKSTWILSVPQGLRDVLIWIKNRYDNPSVFISENGWSDDGELEDKGRIEYLKEHMASVAKVIIEDGCNVIGYTVWSIIDNFEWNQGYTEKFGIFAVNMSSPTKERTPKKSAQFMKTFPDVLKFGSASAAYQVEGAWNLDGKTPSIWDTMTHDHPELIADHSTGDVGPDSYHFYKEDVKALKSVGFQHYRFSVAWPRIIPDISLVVNQKGIDYYSALIDELIANDIEPIITMYHWDLPQYIQDLGGFVNPLIIEYFENYADVLFKNFGDRVKRWITFNEPYNFCVEGYGVGVVAPLIKAAGVGEYLCTHYMLQAHAAAYHLSKNKYKEQNSQLGISLNTKHHFSKDPRNGDYISNRAQTYRLGLFANPIFSKEGGYPQIMIDEIGNSSVKEGHPWSRLPTMTDEVKKSIQGTADFFGFNYYTSRIVKPMKKTSKNIPGFANDVGLEMMIDPTWKQAKSKWLFDVPQGLHEVLIWIKNNYDNPPVFISENGWSDDGEMEDNGRIEYLTGHMISVAKAINEDNCNIIGYTVWSIIDNFEWNEGYTEKFGIFAVNMSSPTRERIPKKSVNFVREVIEQRSIYV
ncbi:unnamed protein product [Diamesa serratosioi]